MPSSLEVRVFLPRKDTGEALCDGEVYELARRQPGVCWSHLPKAILRRGKGEDVRHPSAAAAPKLFPGYGRRAKRVLFLSATPLEETYRHVWNQVDVFGPGGAYEQLRRSDLTE